MRKYAFALVLVPVFAYGVTTTLEYEDSRETTSRAAISNEIATAVNSVTNVSDNWSGEQGTLSLRYANFWRGPFTDFSGHNYIVELTYSAPYWTLQDDASGLYLDASVEGSASSRRLVFALADDSTAATALGTNKIVLVRSGLLSDFARVDEIADWARAGQPEPQGGVTSVNTKTGAVVIAAADVSAIPSTTGKHQTSPGCTTDYLASGAVGGPRVIASSANPENDYTAYVRMGIAVKRSGGATKDYLYDDSPNGIARMGDVAASVPGNYATVSNRAMSAIQSHQSLANYYTKGETESKIVELAPAPGNYETVSNRAMNAITVAPEVFATNLIKTVMSNSLYNLTYDQTLGVTWRKTAEGGAFYERCYTNINMTGVQP